MLGRDRFGKKPLYYWCSTDALVVRERDQGVLRTPPFPAADPRAIPAYLTFGYVPTPSTFLRGHPQPAARARAHARSRRGAPGRPLLGARAPVRRRRRAWAVTGLGCRRGPAPPDRCGEPELVSDRPARGVPERGDRLERGGRRDGTPERRTVTTFTIGFDDRDGYGRAPVRSSGCRALRDRPPRVRSRSECRRAGRAPRVASTTSRSAIRARSNLPPQRADARPRHRRALRRLRDELFGGLRALRRGVCGGAIRARAWAVARGRSPRAALVPPAALHGRVGNAQPSRRRRRTGCRRRTSGG